MKATWETKTLGSVCEKIQDGAHHSPKTTEPTRRAGLFPYVTSKNIRHWHLDTENITFVGSDFHDTIYPRCNAEYGDILLTKDGANTGQVTINTFREPISLLSSVCLIKPDREQLDSRYLVYYIQSDDGFENITGQMTGAAIKRIILKRIKSSEIPLPPLEEQQRIVAVLDEAFEGLARARAHAEANLQNARELFENYREDFLNPARREGWSFHKLDDLITIKHGFAFKSAFFVDQGQYAVLTPGNYHETGGFRDRGEKQRYYSGEFPPEFLLSKDDLLMAMTEQAAGLLGSCMIVPQNDVFLHNQRLGLISPKEGVAWSPKYFAQAFNLKAFRKGLSDTCSGATVRHTSPKRILAESIPYSADVVALDAVASDLDEREKDCQNLEDAYRKKLQDIDDLRQSLLQKAFAGELT